MTIMNFIKKEEYQQYSYKIQTLGKFDVIKNDISLVMSTSSSKKIWELFKFMLTNRERNYTPEDLMDQLWVSEEYNDPRSTLRRQMHRLRKILDEDSDESETTLLFSNSHYRWNKKLFIYVDVDLFESLINKGDELLKKEPDKALIAYLKAIDLYDGDYLQECVDQHWVFPIRNHYRRLFLKAMLNSIEILKDDNNQDEILRICQKAIKIDNYEEVFHITYIDSLLATGQKRQALEHYENITSFYYREMGIKPSLEMRAIYKKILKNNTTINSERNISEILETDSVFDNAFFCEPEVFKSIYELERRRSQRSNTSFSIGVITTIPIKGYSKSQEELRINHIKQHLMNKLRKGDTFTLWNEEQFVVLLLGVDATQTEIVLNRVLEIDKGNSSIIVNQITQLASQTQNNKL